MPHDHGSLGLRPGDPAAARDLRKQKLRGALAVTGAVFFVEVVGGFLSGSLALLADATHMFTDVAALLLAYAATTLATRAPSREYSFGLYRAEILAAFVNAQALLLMSGYIFYEAYQRIWAPPEVATGIMLWVAVLGLVANLVAMKLLTPGSDQSMNLRAAYLEVVADTLGSIGVIAASLAMARWGWYWLDAGVSVGIGALIVPRTVSLLKHSAHVLLEGTPVDMDLEALTKEIEGIPGVEEIHDLHVWTLTSGLNAASLHVRVGEDDGGKAALEGVQQVLRDSAGVEHATIQVEWGPPGSCSTSELHF